MSTVFSVSARIAALAASTTDLPDPAGPLTLRYPEAGQSVISFLCSASSLSGSRCMRAKSGSSSHPRRSAASSGRIRRDLSLVASGKIDLRLPDVTSREPVMGLYFGEFGVLPVPGEGTEQRLDSFGRCEGKDDAGGDSTEAGSLFETWAISQPVDGPLVELDLRNGFAPRSRTGGRSSGRRGPDSPCTSRQRNTP